MPGLPDSCVGVTGEAETLLAADPGDRNHLVALWQAGFNNTANTAITAESRDGGATWSRAFVPGTGPCTGGVDDYVMDQWVDVGADGAAYYDTFAGHNGDASATPFDAQVLVASSAAGARAWPAAAVLDDNLQGAKGVISRTTIAADPAVPLRAWAVWARVLSPAFQGVFVARTDDGGLTWGTPVQAANVNGGAAVSWRLVVRPDGGLVLFYGEVDTADTVEEGLYPVLGQLPAVTHSVAQSTDEGQTWSYLGTIAGPATFRSVPSGAVAPDGTLYFVWDVVDAGTATVELSRSVDGGANWGPAQAVATFPAGPLGAPPATVAPNVAVSADGTVGVSYYSGEAGNGRIARWFARSRDSGATWTAQPLCEPFAADDTPGGNGDGYQGAYHGLAPIGNGFGAVFIAGTGDPSNPTDVVFAHIDP